MHSGNILWAIDSDGNIQNKIATFIDWQTIREGSPTEDLARFFIMCADGVVRRQAEEFAVHYYFECLVKEFAMKKNGLGVVPFFLGNINDKTEENVKNAFRDFITLKVLHLYEDLDKLLRGELKDIFDKFGLIKL